MQHTGFAQMDAPFNSASQTVTRLQLNPSHPHSSVRSGKTGAARSCRTGVTPGVRPAPPRAGIPSGPRKPGGGRGEEDRPLARCVAGGLDPPPSSRWAGPPGSSTFWPNSQALDASSSIQPGVILGVLFRETRAPLLLNLLKDNDIDV